MFLGNITYTVDNYSKNVMGSRRYCQTKILETRRDKHVCANVDHSARK